jgi:hypothetical protein
MLHSKLLCYWQQERAKHRIAEANFLFQARNLRGPQRLLAACFTTKYYTMLCLSIPTPLWVKTQAFKRL